MSKLNLLMLNYEFPPIGGGAANAHLCLLKQYAGNSDLRVDVLTSAPKPGFFVEKFSENITIYKVGLHKKDLHFWRKTEVVEWLLKAKSHYRALLQENDYDLAHAFFGFPTAWLCYRSAKKLPYIISLRGSDVPGKHARLQLDYKILAPVFRAIWKKAAALVACSEGLKNRALNFLPTVTIDVIPNGVELDRFSPATCGQGLAPGTGPGAKRSSQVLRLLTVGRLSVTKRVEMLIDAVQMLRRDGCNVHFTIVGGGQMAQQLRQIVAEKNLSNIIEITGRLNSGKMPQVYQQHNIFVSASMQEGMSNAMLEAMACGLPIVTTHCEGVEELIKDNGIVVEKAQADQIAKATKKLADDQQTYRKFSTAARKQAEKFGWPQVAAQYLSYYNKIAHSARTNELKQ
ncbi:MAG: glycosyltransferase family 4 protein [Sedimentisphaerales bacterium]